MSEMLTWLYMMNGYFQLMMDLILSQRVNSDLMPNASSTLYLLMCNYQVILSSYVIAVEFFPIKSFPGNIVLIKRLVWVWVH